MKVYNEMINKKDIDIEKERCNEWQVVIDLVNSHFKDINKTILWIKSNNPNLGQVSPRYLIRMGRFTKLLKFIQTSLSENR